MSDDLERLAAALWKAQVTDAGTPQSVIDARTPEAFTDEHPDTRKTWLKFADAALAEMGGVRVKPLVWDVVHPVLHQSARNILGKYICSKTNNAHNDRYMVTYLTPTASSETIGYIDGIEAAKAAAQADYEARILAAIDPAPVSVREAARVLLDEWRQGEGPLGELCCYSLDEGGTMQPDIDGRWVEFTKIEAALFRAIIEGKDDE